MPKFTFDDRVKVRLTVETRRRPGSKAWVIGVIEDRNTFPLIQFPPGVIYLVEYEDGDAVQVHEEDLEPA